VYFYCNDRLVARALKTFEVGFTKGLAGLPHPKVSLTRVLVSLNGDAWSMPWNSSKSDISTKHEVFLALHNWLVQVVKDYASLSRIWMGDWPNKVFKHTTGTIKEVEVTDFPTVKKSFLPPLPKSRPRYGEIITQKNKAIAKKKPWTRGLYEGVIAADLISNQNLEQKNRLRLSFSTARWKSHSRSIWSMNREPLMVMLSFCNFSRTATQFTVRSRNIRQSR
jgi:hypothetical protein